MRCLTLLQPWATLVAIGRKTYETRGWPIRSMGPLAIHSAKRFEEGGPGDELCQTEPVKTWLAQLHPLPRGDVIAIVDVTGCLRVTPAAVKLLAPSPREMSLGDWSDGRYVWRLERIALLAPPVPASGRQKLWDWTPPERPFGDEGGLCVAGCGRYGVLGDRCRLCGTPGFWQEAPS